MSTAKGGMSFEEQLNALEELANRMEEGEMPLEEALKAYEKGMVLARELNKQLDQAEKRILEIAGDEMKPLEAEEDA